MTWFRPGSLEPLRMFETVGVLTSLAVYNGLTLPFTFPNALYRAIAGLPCETVADISDGWPEQARSMQTLLDWRDDDIEDTFVLSYNFSTNIFGAAIDIDMDHSRRSNSPSTPNTLLQGLPSQFPPSPVMINKSNRHAYVRDYIIHLTHHSVYPQLSAFIAGFHRCLPPRIHEMFTEPALKDLVEGYDHIDTHLLERATKYEQYHREHPTIKYFWEVVHGWGEDNKIRKRIDPSGENTEGPDLVRKLLEFVTASDRLPTGGMQRLQFVIQRNGEGDERLPSSMTCFGRLLLPEFSGIEALRTGLERAITEGLGFGLQ